LPKNQQSKTAQITQIVCKDVVYTIIWIQPIHIIVIENDVVANEYIDLYKILWDVSKNIV